MRPLGPRRPTEVREASVIDVIRVIAVEGAGTDSDPVRTVSYYYLPEGILIARIDPQDQKEQTP